MLLCPFREKHSRQLKQLSTSFEKIQELYHLEDNLWYHTLDLPLRFPEMVDFVQTITRTKVVHLPLEELKRPYPSIVADYVNHFLYDYASVNRPRINELDVSAKAEAVRHDRKRKWIAELMESVLRGVVAANDPLLLAGGGGRGGSDELFQVDEGATVETFFKRMTPKEMWDSTDVVEDVFDRVDETVVDKEGCTHYRVRGQLAWQIRTPYPLIPVRPPCVCVCVYLFCF